MDRKLEAVNVYAYYDKKGKSYEMPFYARTDLQAIRRFELDVRTNDKTVLHNYTEDFDLYHLGEFDLNTGLFTVDSSEEYPKRIKTGKEIDK